MRLFNAIAAAQGAPEKAEKEEAKKRKREDGESEAGSVGTTADGAPPVKVLRRPNVLGGRGKGEARAYFHGFWSFSRFEVLICLRASQ